jgi:hypothetical protein
MAKTDDKTFTLDNLRKSLDDKYAPVVIDGIELKPVLRMNTADRTTVAGLIDELTGEKEMTPEEAFEVIRKLIRCAAGDQGPKLVDAIGDDLALAMSIVELWIGSTQPGEASSSQS